MPAMRFSVLMIILLSVSGTWPALAAADLSSAKTDTVAEPGPLTPDTAQLDSLYARLKRERSPESARSIADTIAQALAQSGSPTIDMLMNHATKAASEKRFGAALDFLDQVTLLAPDFAEGWNRRATLHYIMGNPAKAMSDTARALTLEPRHLGALAGLAGILAESGRDAQALESLESYLGYFPADREVQKQALELINKLAGQKT